jgi:hypothetical protein
MCWVHACVCNEEKKATTRVHENKLLDWQVSDIALQRDGLVVVHKRNLDAHAQRLL